MENMKEPTNLEKRKLYFRKYMRERYRKNRPPTLKEQVNRLSQNNRVLEQQNELYKKEKEYMIIQCKKLLDFLEERSGPFS